MDELDKINKELERIDKIGKLLIFGLISPIIFGIFTGIVFNDFSSGAGFGLFFMIITWVISLIMMWKYNKTRILLE